MPTAAQIQAEAEAERRRRREIEEGEASVDECGTRPHPFINSYCRIDDVQLTFGSQGILPFKLWPKQTELLNTIVDNHKVVILKARQLGISWLLCAFILWVCLFHANQMCLIFSKSQDEANELLRRVRVLYERLPAWLKRVLPRPSNIWGTEALEWRNGSRVKAFPSTPNSGRTYTASVVVIDECAFIQWDRGLYAALKPTIDGGGRLVVLSTANGIDNLFFDLWDKSSKDLTGATGYATVFLSCLDRPDRDLAWYARMEAEALDPYLFHQEYPLSAEEAFVLTARNPFLPTPLWWDNCHTGRDALDRILGFRPRLQVVLALDAAVSGASFGIVGVSRIPRSTPDRTIVRYVKEYKPYGKPLDYKMIRRDIIDLCERFNVAQICYDPYQLHGMMGDVEDQFPVWVSPFIQMGERLIADSRLLASVRDQQFEHQGQEELRTHALNADRKVDGEERKIRIVRGRGPVDLLVCASMANHRSLELNI